MRTMIVLALLLTGCNQDWFTVKQRQSPQYRREQLVRDCISQGQNAVDCANSAQMTIPDNDAIPAK